MIFLMVLIWNLVGHVFGSSDLNKLDNLYSLNKNEKFSFRSVSSTLNIPYYTNDYTKKAVE